MLPKKRTLSGGRTVLLLDGTWFKLVQISGGPVGRIIQKVFAQRIKEIPEAEALKTLAKAVGSDSEFDPGIVWIANPSQFTTVRLSTFPSTDPKEIGQIVELQAERYTPYAKEEILTGFRLIGRDPSGYSRVLIVISHRDIVQRAVSTAQGLGWSPAKVGCDLEGLAHWFQMVRGKEKGPSSSATALLADVDQETTTLVILQEGRPYFHRSITCGLSQLVSAEGTSPLVGELQRSIEAFEAEGYNLSPGEVILTGRADQVPSLKEAVGQALNLPTAVIPTFAHLALSKEATAAVGTFKEVSFTPLIGLLLGPAELDLTPPSIRLRQAFEGRARALMVLGGQLVALLLLLTSLCFAKAVKANAYQAQLTRASQAISGKAGEVSRSIEKIHLIQGRLENRGELLEIVSVISQLLPSEIRLESITFEAAQTVSFRGSSSEMPKVFELVSELGSIPLFTEVNARRAAQRKQEGKDVADFEIVCALRGGSIADAEDQDSP